jgi:hypothetical protein
VIVASSPNLDGLRRDASIEPHEFDSTPAPAPAPAVPVGDSAAHPYSTTPSSQSPPPTISLLQQRLAALETLLQLQGGELRQEHSDEQQTVAEAKQVSEAKGSAVDECSEKGGALLVQRWRGQVFGLLLERERIKISTAADNDRAREQLASAEEEVQARQSALVQLEQRLEASTAGAQLLQKENMELLRQQRQWARREGAQARVEEQRLSMAELQRMLVQFVAHLPLPTPHTLPTVPLVAAPLVAAPSPVGSGQQGQHEFLASSVDSASWVRSLVTAEARLDAMGHRLVLGMGRLQLLGTLLRHRRMRTEAREQALASDKDAWLRMQRIARSGGGCLGRGRGVAISNG